MSKNAEQKLRQEREIFGVDAEVCAVKVEEEEHEGRLEFQPSVGSGRCSRSVEPAGVLYTGTRWFSVHVENVEWKLRGERGVFGVKAEGCAVEVEEEEHERKLEFQPSVGSGRCRGSLEPAGVLYTGTRWFCVHVERCGLEAETGACSLWC